MGEGEGYEDNGLVVSTKKGRMVTQRNLATKLHRLLAKAEIPKTNLHSLRHTYAIRLLEAGYIRKWFRNCWAMGAFGLRWISIVMCFLTLRNRLTVNTINITL
ncbi:hypothetical protein H1S01_11230 [Heliobacterium chlorum]|uniref:Tyr recombinase domain-containing protein n=1 Tax=Heliobacterium chlorum TaxID=2698 RepID=A0ABR7T570_HELCL|nr:hypothetical protein [Heliobacterium chlorum]